MSQSNTQMSEQTDTVTLSKWVLEEIHCVAEKNKEAYYAECQKNKKLMTEFSEHVQELESQLAVALAERNQADEANKRLSDSLALCRQALEGERTARVGERYMVAKYQGDISRLTAQIEKAKPAKSHKVQRSLYDIVSRPTTSDIKEMFQDIINQGRLPAGVPKTLTAKQMTELCDAVKEAWVCPLECDDELRDTLMDYVVGTLTESFKAEA